jgi:adenosylmethionine-8-amino-7-oxononanoate aminotransferase
MRSSTRLAYAHTSFFTSDVAEQLADELIGAAPDGMSHAYLVSGGSEAVESALKMARQYFVEIGQPRRTHFIARRQSYHGNTLGALAVGGNAWRREPFAPILVPATHVSPCYPYREQRADESAEQYGQRLAAELEAAILAQGADRVIAFVAETVGGATAGVLVPVPGYFKAVRAVCDKYGVLLILDEVMCGMGRTGTLHACEQEGVVPDLVTIAKGLGGGYQPVGAVLAQRKIVEAMSQGSGFFQHGHTYLGHPMACAAALAVQRVIRRDGLVAKVRDDGVAFGPDAARRAGRAPARGRHPRARLLLGHRAGGRPREQGALRSGAQAQRRRQEGRHGARPAVLPLRRHGRRAPGRPRAAGAALHRHAARAAD